MAEISRLSRLVGAVVRGVDLATNTLVVGDIKIGGGAGTLLTKTILDKLITLQDGSDFATGTNSHTHDGRYFTETELGSVAGTSGADRIGIKDTAAQFTATTVEGALAEALDAAQAAQADATQALSDASDAQDAADAAQADVDDLVTLSGRPVNSEDLGTFTGVTIPDASTIKAALQSLETSLEAMPDPMEYKGNWEASNNTPELEDGVGNNGDVYYVVDDGVVDFGSGNISFSQGDRVVYSGADSVWQKWDTTDQVTSVNGQTGAVTLDTDDIAEAGNLYYTAARFNTAFSGKSTTDLAEGTNLYHTTSRARTAAVVDSTAGDQTDQAPSVSAIKDYVDAAVAAIASESLVRTADAGETLAAASLFAVRWGRPADTETAGRLYLADPDATTDDNFHVAGLVLTVAEAEAGDPVTMVKQGKLTVTAHGFTVGMPLWLDDAGAITDVAPTTADFAAVKLGIAEDANTIDVSIQIMGVN